MFTILPNQVKRRSGFWYGLEMNKFLSYNWSLIEAFSNYVIVHCVKCVRTRSFPDPYFPAFGAEKLQRRTTDTFQAIVALPKLQNYCKTFLQIVV